MPKTGKADGRRVVKARVPRMRTAIFRRGIPSNLSAFSCRDRVIVERQMDNRVFDPRLVLGVSSRCRWGIPQTIACRPFYKRRPFPTLFWLTCPYLSQICGTIESSGGVRDLEKYLAERKKSYNDYNRLYALMRLALLSEAEKRVLKMYLPKLWRVISRSGIGGIAMGEKPTVKCLHLQTATYLSLPGHPGGAWFNKRLGKFDCDNWQCRIYSCYDK